MKSELTNASKQCGHLNINQLEKLYFGTPKVWELFYQSNVKCLVWNEKFKAILVQNKTAQNKTSCASSRVLDNKMRKKNISKIRVAPNGQSTSCASTTSFVIRKTMGMVLQCVILVVQYKQPQLVNGIGLCQK